MSHWTVIDTRCVFANPVLELHLESVRTPDGREGEWTVVAIGDGVAVLPVDDDGSVWLIRQYRHAVGDHVWELPAGRREEGEDPADTARRELEEEAGLRAREVEPLMRLWPLDGVCRHRIFFYLARGLESVPARRESFEEIEAVRFSRPRVREMIMSGEIEDGLAVAALSRYLLATSTDGDAA